ncbi:MAG: hypothetical protein ABH842_01965 [Candidatus Micrarchaeota archaeon]
MKNTPNLEELYAYLFSRFGIERILFDNFQLYLGSKGKIYLGPKKAVDLPKVTTIGISIARMDNSIKPTTNMFQLFGNEISKNFIELTKEQAIDYVNGSDLILNNSGLEDGYILLKYKNKSLGCGLLKNNSVKNMLPKAKRMKLNYL